MDEVRENRLRDSRRKTLLERLNALDKYIKAHCEEFSPRVVYGLEVACSIPEVVRFLDHDILQILYTQMPYLESLSSSDFDGFCWFFRGFAITKLATVSVYNAIRRSIYRMNESQEFKGLTHYARQAPPKVQSIHRRFLDLMKAIASEKKTPWFMTAEQCFDVNVSE